ncbi:GDP-L-fucose synthase, partial [Aureibaculum marinum]
NTHINIGCGKDQSIEELALMVKKIVGYKGEINWDKNKPDGTFQKLMDVSKLNNLNWYPKIDLENGLESVYNNYLRYA